MQETSGSSAWLCCYTARSSIGLLLSLLGACLQLLCVCVLPGAVSAPAPAAGELKNSGLTFQGVTDAVSGGNEFGICSVTCWAALLGSSSVWIT